MRLKIQSIILTLILICIILIVYNIYTVKEIKNVDDLVELYKNTGIDPVKTTLYKNKSGNFVNLIYSVENDSGIYKKVEETHAYKTDGTIYNENDTQHGIITELIDGFKISGIEKYFKCPDPFIWNGEYCKLPDLCTDIEQYVGIPYDYKILYDNNNNTTKKYHEKLYLRCPNNELRSCSDVTIYKGDAIVPINENPCIPYDICIQHIDSYRHTVKINDYNLKSNEFYLCQNGKSVLVVCDDDLEFDEENNTCLSMVCDNGDRKVLDTDSYYECRGGVYRIVTCQNGTDETGINCKPIDFCEGIEPIVTYYTDDIGGISSIEYCINNEMHSVNIPVEEVIYKIEKFALESGENIQYCNNDYLIDQQYSYMRYAILLEDYSIYDRLKDVRLYNITNIGSGFYRLTKVHGFTDIETNIKNYKNFIRLNGQFTLFTIPIYNNDNNTISYVQSQRYININIENTSFTNEQFTIPLVDDDTLELIENETVTIKIDKDKIENDQELKKNEKNNIIIDVNFDCNNTFLLVSVHDTNDHFKLVPLIVYYCENDYLLNVTNKIKQNIKNFYYYLSKNKYIPYYFEENIYRNITSSSSNIFVKDNNEEFDEKTLDEVFPIIKGGFYVKIEIVTDNLPFNIYEFINNLGCGFVFSTEEITGEEYIGGSINNNNDDDDIGYKINELYKISYFTYYQNGSVYTLNVFEPKLVINQIMKKTIHINTSIITENIEEENGVIILNSRAKILIYYGTTYWNFTIKNINEENKEGSYYFTYNQFSVESNEYIKVRSLLRKENVFTFYYEK